jgi:hypothetical protein
LDQKKKLVGWDERNVVYVGARIYWILDIRSVLDWQYTTDSCKTAGADLCPATQFGVNDPGGASQIRAFASDFKYLRYSIINVLATLQRLFFWSLSRKELRP